jgi:hypothetical protein
MKAPVLLKVLLESTKPYVIADAFGDNNNDAANKLADSTKKPIRRFIENLLMMKLTGWPGA